MPHRLLFFPDYRQANPYQTLLYRHMAPELLPCPGTIADALEERRRRTHEESVLFHLHWEDAIYRNEADDDTAWQAAQRFLDRLERFVGEGGMVVWTIHNAAPHDGRRGALHAALCRRLAELADVAHLHSLAGAGWARRHLELPCERVAVVPHGNYLPLHRPSGWPQIESRRRLGVPEEARVLLLFGRLDHYKGGEELLAALERLADPRLHLVVAGRQVAPLGLSRHALPGGLTVIDRFVAEEEVAPLFHAADAVALPYRAILTSGTLMLALSLGRPVLAPAFEPLQEVVRDGREALLYEPGAPAALETGLRRLAALDPASLASMQEAASARAELFDWRQSGLLLSGICSRLVALRRPKRLLAGSATDEAPAVPQAEDRRFRPAAE
ncbi:glycosyltransferase [Geminicoccaceae bacterium 1502E]|nr:glycosyltransferase [Geminicoccaceae bacterium 1502E]